MAEFFSSPMFLFWFCWSGESVAGYGIEGVLGLVPLLFWLFRF
jgi:hypothetical protein